MDRFGTLRKLRTSIFGAPKVPEDSFGHTRQEIEKFKKIIGAFSKTLERFEKEIHSMHDVHEKLSLELKNFEFRNTDHIKRFSEALDNMTADLSRFEVGNLRRKVQDLGVQIEGLQSLIEKRDAALAEKVHFDKKIAKLSDEKKKERNDVKHEGSIRKYAELDQKVLHESEEMLKRREQVIQDLVLEYMQAYQKLFKNLNDTFSRASLVRMSSKRPVTGPPVPSAPVLEETFNYS